MLAKIKEDIWNVSGCLASAEYNISPQIFYSRNNNYAFHVHDQSVEKSELLCSCPKS